MRINEIIREDVSPEASQKNIVDVLTTELPQLYHKLSIMAEKMFNNKGNLDGFKLVSGSQKSTWYQDVYFSNLKSALYNFAKSLSPQVRSELQGFLGTNDSKFSNVQNILLDILQRIAKTTKNTRLLSAVNASVTALNNYENKIDELESKSGEDDEDEPRQNTKAVKDPNVGKQYSEIENIINDVLGQIDKKQAGEIRNAISRTDNKLLALRQELNKRNIKV